jgi:hypothetical protein
MSSRGPIYQRPEYADPNAPIYLGNPVGISAYADQQTDAANTFLLRLGEAVAGLQPPTIDPDFPAGPSAPGQLTVTAPTFQPVVWTSPSAPSSFTEELDVTSVMPDPFDEEPPVLSFAAAPAPFSELAPDAPGVNLVFEDPGLTVDLPATPDLLAISVRPFDGITLPDIDPDAVPTLDVVAPSIREYTPGADYTSALLTALKTSLQDRIENGGTGLNPDVEDAIWDRGREREARSAANAQAELDRMEAMGFALPPGVYLDAHLKLMTEMDYVNRGHSREVMIKQAELEQTNVLAALQTSQVLENSLITYANAVEQRLFDATKYATEAGVAIYNAQVQAYAAYVDAYKTKIQIYEAQVRAQIALVEAYKAEIEAETAKAQVNTALVQQYTAQVQAALSAVDIYRARIDGIKVKAEIEKMKIETYGEQIKAYAAKIGAFTAGVEGYRASIEAEGTKQKVFQSQVEAFRAQVEAGARDAEVRIAAYKGRIEAKQLELQAFKAIYEGEAAQAQAIAAFNSSLADEFKAEVTAVTSYNEVLTKQWQVALDQAQRVSEIGVSAAKANAELYITTRSLAVDAAKVGAQVSAQLGAAALNAINWSQSFSSSLNLGVSDSFSSSQSWSESESVNTNYNYSASV